MSRTAPAPDYLLLEAARVVDAGAPLNLVAVHYGTSSRRLAKFCEAKSIRTRPKGRPRKGNEAVRIEDAMRKAGVSEPPVRPTPLCDCLKNPPTYTVNDVTRCRCCRRLVRQRSA